ncbi:unnamed protein product [Linum trigynum]|uniref:Uncharacterized protein n=1 Tax=Linum trigynum TaxID=586398 RepID=A0AAV2ELT1_9ROSI
MASSEGRELFVWDCGSPLYDSHEVASLGHLIDRRTMSLPWYSGRWIINPPPSAPTGPDAARRPSTVRSLAANLVRRRRESKSSSSENSRAAAAAAAKTTAFWLVKMSCFAAGFCKPNSSVDVIDML